VRIAVVITADGRHPGWLAAALRSVDDQHPRPAQRCLVLDSSDGAAAADPTGGWTVRRGDWGDPAAAPNEGLAATGAPWVVFWDADNVMPDGFLAAVADAVQQAEPDVGIVYSDIEYVDENLGHGFVWRVPDCDYWSLREDNCVDTASAWRREALELCGGWPRGFGAFEDYALALELTRRGWQARRRDGPPIVMRQHDGRRTQARIRDSGRLTDLWQARTLAIVSLLAGRASTYERWENFLDTAELPRHTSLYVVDNSGDAAFTRRVHQTAHELGVTRQCPGWARTSCSPLEGDVEPPPDAIPRLAEHIRRHASGSCAAVAGAYDFGDGKLCAGRAGGGWGSPVYWHELSDEPIDVECVGGGCTLWAN